jgi:hypothetical protein
VLATLELIRQALQDKRLPESETRTRHMYALTLGFQVLFDYRRSRVEDDKIDFRATAKLQSLLHAFEDILIEAISQFGAHPYVLNHGCCEAVCTIIYDRRCQGVAVPLGLVHAMLTCFHMEDVVPWDTLGWPTEEQWDDLLHLVHVNVCRVPVETRDRDVWPALQVEYADSPYRPDVTWENVRERRQRAVGFDRFELRHHSFSLHPPRDSLAII